MDVDEWENTVYVMGNVTARELEHIVLHKHL